MSHLIELERAIDREITIRRGEQSYMISDRIPVSAAPLLLRVAEGFEQPGEFDESTWDALRKLMLKLFQMRYPDMTQEALDDFLGIDGYAQLAAHFFERRVPVDPDLPGWNDA